MNHGNRLWRIRFWRPMLACVVGLALFTSPTSHAEPATNDPYPNINIILNTYQSVKYDDYFTASSGGVWFSTPLGLNCGIWDRGAFGCTGDIRGSGGATNIGWVSGQIRMRTDPGFAFLTPPGRAERELPLRNYIDYNGTRCVTTGDGSTFCSRGPFKFFVTPTGTWLSPP